MKNFEEEKLKEEIKKMKVDRYADLLKGLGVFVGSIVLFIAIQMPESILNKKMSDESINRERAKLVLDIVHNNNDDNIMLELSVIEKAYPDKDNAWINAIKDVYQTRIDIAKNSVDNTDNEEIILAKDELQGLLNEKKNLQTQLITNPDADSLILQIEEYNEQITSRRISIDNLKRKNAENSKIDNKTNIRNILKKN